MKNQELKIIHLTDLHGAWFLISEASEDIKKSDLAIISGDLTHFGKDKEIRNIFKKLKRLNNTIYAVSGNCDYPEVDNYLSDKKLNINRTVVSYKNYILAGFGGSLPCPGRTPNEFTEDEAENWLTDLSLSIQGNENLIFVSHQPPYMTKNDLLEDGKHVGSKAVRKFIEKATPFLCLTGHIHEAIGIDNIGRCKIVNPGPFRTGKYALITIDSDNQVEIELKQLTA